MSGSGEKTEKPTPKRLSDARKKGQVAKSVDLNAALVLGGIAMIIMIYGNSFFEYLMRLTRDMLRNHLAQAAENMTPQSFQLLFQDVTYHYIIVVAPFLVGVMFIGVLANIAQVRILFTMEPLKPNLAKINPLEGFKRMFSQKSLVELIKGILKMVIVAVCAWSIIQSQHDHLMAMTRMSFSQSWLLIFQTALNICVTTAIVLLVLGIADWWYQHYQLMKQLRMSRQDIKDEMKNTEGNPEVKRKVRQTGQALIRQQITKNVPTADVIVTNPTHFAVAIQYDPDVAPAPRVVAKGADHLAFKIRELAKEHGVPIVENKPLARQMYAQIEVGHMIPPDLFIAVAEVLAYVFKKNKGRKNRHARRMINNGGTR